jgi:DNA polymerase III delta prime subunit
MAELLINQATGSQIKLLLKSPPHAVLITGQAGAGKRAIADYIAALLLAIPQEKLPNHPYFFVIEKQGDKKEISIESVRSVVKKLGLKPAIGAQNPVNRIVLIDDAHQSSHESQNALLKAIEEPPAGTVFILTSLSDAAVLPTISSRAQKLKVGSVSLDEAKDYFKNGQNDTAIESAWQLSGGAAGLLAALVKDDSEHPLKKSVEDAKKILSLDKYQRAKYLDELSSSKSDFAVTLDALDRILAALNRSAIRNQNDKNSDRLIKARKQVNSTLASLHNNASPKLAALNLALSLPV